MKLRKVDWWEVPQKKAVTSNNNVSVLPAHTKEVIRETVKTEVQGIPELESLRKEVETLKKRRPEYVGGSGSVGTYHHVDVPEFTFRKSSFQPGINVIGVASGVPTTIWLPKDLEHNHLIAVKDELGIAFEQPITIRVKTS